MFPLPGQATTAAASSSGGGGDDDDYDDMLDSELDYGSLNSEMRSVRLVAPMVLPINAPPNEHLHVTDR